MRLNVRLREWTDATKTPATRHPEILITGDAMGLRMLRDQIDFVLGAAGEAHTHILDGDEGVRTDPPRLMVTIDRIDPESGSANGAAVHSAP